MLDHFVDLSILDLDWISKIIDSDLDIEHLTKGVVQFLKRRIPAKRAILFLWDEEKESFCHKIVLTRKRLPLNTRLRARRF